MGLVLRNRPPGAHPVPVVLGVSHPCVAIGDTPLLGCHFTTPALYRSCASRSFLAMPSRISSQERSGIGGASSSGAISVTLRLDKGSVPLWVGTVCSDLVGTVCSDFRTGLFSDCSDSRNSGNL